MSRPIEDALALKTMQRPSLLLMSRWGVFEGRVLCDSDIAAFHQMVTDPGGSPSRHACSEHDMETGVLIGGHPT